MRKINLLLLLTSLTFSIKAQFSYSPANSSTLSTTYTDLGTTGTAITTANTDDANSAAIPIGFTFNYNGTAFTDFIFNTNGFIKLGTTVPSSAALFGASSQDATGSALLSTNAADINIIAIFNHDLDAGVGGTTEYRSSTTGTVGSRVCTIQYKNVKDKTTTPVAILQNLMSFQIKLYEGTNNIDFVFNTFTASAAANPNFKVAGTGIKGTSNSVGNIVFVRKASTAAWSAATFGNSGVTTQIFNFRNNAQPDAGRTYRFIAALPNDAKVNTIYTLGKVPIPNAATRTDSVNIGNIGLNTLTSVNVTLTISGANTFTDTKTISSLAAGASANVIFAPYTLTNEGNNTYTVSLANDDNNANNTLAITQVVNKNTWSYAYSATADGGVGFNGSTGDFVAKFNTNAATTLVQVSANFFAGGQPYQIGIWDASGVGGTPGAVLYTSPTYTSTTGVNVQPVTPAVNIPIGNYYVGVKQTGTTNVSFAYQTETPIRTQTFYFTSPGGGTSWTDFAPANAFKFMIEPKLILPTDVGVSNIVTPQGVSCLGTNETVTVRLANLGINAITAGAANVTLKVAGANTYTSTKPNVAAIASGGFETITFTGVNFSNPGTNLDTVRVTLTGDQDVSNDRTTASNLTAPTINTLPAIENAETTVGAFPVFNYLSVVNGSRQLWGIRNTPYTNADQTAALPPQGGSQFFLFDAYSGASSANFNSRLYSNCITIPTDGSSCDKYVSFFMSHDNTSATPELDSMYVSISVDKGITWTRQPIIGIGAGLQRHDATLTANAAPIWRKDSVNLSAFEGQTIQIGFEGVSKYGNAFGLDNVSIYSSSTGNVQLNPNVATQNLTEGCTDDNGWTYYQDANNRLLLGVQWGSNSAAKSAASASITLDLNRTAASTLLAGGQSKATYAMKRYWNMDIGAATLSTPVNLRFFYNPTEKTDIDNEALSFQTMAVPLGGAALRPSTWFKTVGAPYNPNVSNFTPDGIGDGAIPLTDVNAGPAATINGVLYAQFNGITSFSGGTYSTGVGPGTTLQVNITNLRGQVTGATNTVSWTTATEANNRKFVVERSTNGTSFAPIGEVATRAAGGNSSVALSYSFVDANPVQGKQYYRLQMVDNSGRATYSQIVTLRRGAGKLEIVDVRPNPTTANLYFNLLGVNNNSQFTLTLRTVEGKAVMIKSNFTPLGAGVIDMSKLANGLYILEAIDVKTNEKALFKIVKQ